MIKSTASGDELSQARSLEVYVLQGRYRRRDDCGRRRRLSFWLVDLVDSVSSGATFSQLTSSSFQLSKHAFRGTRFVGDFLRFTEDGAFDLDGAVLYTGDLGARNAASLNRVASQVRSYCSGSVITVGQHAWPKSSVRLVGAWTTTAETALAAMAFLPGVGAVKGWPKQFHFGDAFEQFGPSRRNAVLIQALWSIQSSQLTFSDSSFREAVRESPLIVAQVAGNDERIQHHLSRLERTLKRSATAARIVLMASTNEHSELQVSTDIAAVAMIVYLG